MLNLLGFQCLGLPLHNLRVDDLTEQKEYSLSPVTRDHVAELAGAAAHSRLFQREDAPMLPAPLAPTVRDMLQEYEIASGGKAQLGDPGPAR